LRGVSNRPWARRFRGADRSRRVQFGGGTIQGPANPSALWNRSFIIATRSRRLAGNRRLAWSGVVRELKGYSQHDGTLIAPSYPFAKKEKIWWSLVAGEKPPGPGGHCAGLKPARDIHAGTDCTRMPVLEPTKPNRPRASFLHGERHRPLGFVWAVNGMARDAGSFGWQIDEEFGKQNTGSFCFFTQWEQGNFYFHGYASLGKGLEGRGAPCTKLKVTGEQEKTRQKKGTACRRDRPLSW